MGTIRNKEKIKLFCAECKKEFYIYLSTYRRRGGKFCSQKCCGRYASKNYVGQRRYNWKGGRHISRGYIFLKVLNHPYSIRNRVAEHRLVMEKYLGRYLKPTEIIHHINGNPSDNHIKNLMLCKNYGEHKKAHIPLKKYCSRGHVFSGNNIYLRPNGTRQCSICRKIMKRKWDLKGK